VVTTEDGGKYTCRLCVERVYSDCESDEGGGGHAQDLEVLK
jgi:hypothetical protein